MNTRLFSFPSRLGWMGLLVSGADSPRILRLAFGYETNVQSLAAVRIEGSGDLQPGEVDSDAAVADWAQTLQAFATGEPRDLRHLPLDLSHLTDFGRRVIDACREIEWGQTLSYGQLAKQIGSPGASRAVGAVMARNRHPLIVPCHRVVASNGALCGFSAPDGLEMKRRLLENEKLMGQLRLVGVS